MTIQEKKNTEILNEKIFISEAFEKLDKEQLINLILDGLWEHIHLPSSSMWKINEGTHIFIGDELQLISVYTNILRPIELCIPRQAYNNLREELDTWGFRDFPINIYMGPMLKFNTIFKGENKDKLT